MQGGPCESSPRPTGKADEQVGGAAGASSPAAKTATDALGYNEERNIRQCAKLAGAEDKPALVGYAVTLSRILDDPRLVSMWPTTTTKLASLMRELAGPKSKSRGRLASVQHLTHRSIANE